MDITIFGFSVSVKIAFTNGPISQDTVMTIFNILLMDNNVKWIIDSILLVYYDVSKVGRKSNYHVYGIQYTVYGLRYTRNFI